MTIPGASPFLFKCYDLVTLTHLADIPALGASFGAQLNSAGSMTMSVPIEDPRMEVLNWSEATSPGRTAIFVDYQGSLVCGFETLTRTYQRSQRKVGLGGAEFTAYFKQRIQQHDYAPGSVDPGSEAYWSSFLTEPDPGANPLLIAKQVITDALAVGTIANGLGVSIVQTGTPTNVAVQFPINQWQAVDSIMTTLSQMGYGTGFDFGVDVHYIAGAPVATLTLSFPRRGLIGTSSGQVADVTRAVDWEYNEDAQASANFIYETASGSGGYISQGVDWAPMAVGYPLTEAVISRSNVSSQDVLDACAAGDIAVYAYPVVTGSVTLYADDPGMPLGRFSTGDDFRLVVPAVSGDGTNYDRRFPNGLDYTFRVSQWSCTVPTSGKPTVKIDFVMPPPSSGIALPPPTA